MWKVIRIKDLFDRGHNPSNSTLYPNVLKIKTIIVVNFFLNAICLLFKKQIHNLATLLPGRPSRKVARNGFVNLYIINKWHFCTFLFQNNYCFYFQNIWIQCQMWWIVSQVKQIFEWTSTNIFIHLFQNKTFCILIWKIQVVI